MRLNARAGIYLVGWFDTEKWDLSDSRRRRVPKGSVDEAKAELERQAAALPEGFLVRPGDPRMPRAWLAVAVPLHHAVSPVDAEALSG